MQGAIREEQRGQRGTVVGVAGGEVGVDEGFAGGHGGSGLGWWSNAVAGKDNKDTPRNSALHTVQ